MKKGGRKGRRFYPSKSSDNSFENEKEKKKKKKKKKKIC